MTSGDYFKRVDIDWLEDFVIAKSASTALTTEERYFPNWLSKINYKFRKEFVGNAYAKNVVAF